MWNRGRRYSNGADFGDAEAFLHGGGEKTKISCCDLGGQRSLFRTSTMLPREEILELLRSMGIDLPRKTKLSDAELDKRLCKALDSAQYLTRVLPEPPLDPSVYPSWFADPSNPKLLKGVRRHNMGEATFFAEGKGNPYALYENAFWDLRQTLMGIGNACDMRLENGELYPLGVQNKEDTSAIAMRVLEVRQFDANTPIFLLVYQHDVLNRVSPSSIAWLQDNIDNGRSMVKVHATVKEQELLLRLLKQNSKRLAKSYQPARRSTESSFTLSFLLPVGPLTAKDHAKYNTNNGCIVCGEPAKLKCAKWKSLNFAGGRPSMLSADSGKYQSSMTLNKFDIVQHHEKKRIYTINTEELDENEPPENTHGTSPFIVKVQLNSPNARGPAYQIMPDSGVEGRTMLIYDQRRTFEVMVWAARDPVLFESVADVVRRTGERGLKTFCWAMRTGDWTLDICVDYLPDWQNW
uniref:Fungal-type protein kinase domain-containing protein n=1 Tax=Mycena chlorophos TaxID=658473 RepID=A0ABQ0LFC9_MYCCL|nr:predicted protein [Mycena chlorophos]